MKKWAIAFTAMMLLLVSCGETPDDETPFDFIEVEGGYAVKAKKNLDDEIKGMVNIPDTYKRKPVVEIADYAFFYTSLTVVNIPNSVTRIGDYAFRECSALTSVTLEEGSNLTSIGDYVFEGCASLTSITIPDYVTHIGEGAFAYCDSLVSIVVPNRVESIQKGAFHECGALTSVTLEEGSNLASIEAYTFEGCSSLTSIDIPNSVTSIGDYAFHECSALAFITLEEGSNLASIGAYAFEGCSSLTSIDIPNSVASIGNYAFRECSALASVTLKEESNLASIGAYAFEDCDSLTSIFIPNSVTSIGDYAFKGCLSFSSITIPESVIRIGSFAFADCFNLTIYCEASSESSGWMSDWNFADRPVYWEVARNDIVDQNGLQFLLIEGNAVLTGHHANVVDVVIPETIEVNERSYRVTSIGDYAFKNCSSLISVTLPNSVTHIGKGPSLLVIHWFQ